MSDNEPETNGEERIGEDGRNATQRRMDEELAAEGNAPVGVEIPRMREDRAMSETLPEEPETGDAPESDDGEDSSEESE